MVSRQATSGFSRLSNLKTEVLTEAKRYCSSQNKNIQVVNTSESSPPYEKGNFPEVEVIFMCLDKIEIK
jgi:hypothetical protein